MLGAFKQQCILSLVKRREGRIETDFLSACSTDLVSFGQTNEESRVFCKRSVFLRMFLILVPSPSEKARGPHSSTLTWKIPWTEEPGGLQSMGSLRVGHDGATSLSLFTFIHWRRKWQPSPVFLPGESQGQRSLVGCRL